MLLHLGTFITARRTTTKAVAVSCEKCGCVYLYEMSREAIGIAYETSSFADEESSRLARQHAARVLEYLMANGSDAVPCPDCGWYQSYMLGRAPANGPSIANLNANYPGPPPLVPGSPPPILLRRAMGREGRCYPSLENQKPALDGDGFIVLPWGRHELPNYCATCGQATLSVFRIPCGYPHRRTYGVPMCMLCQNKYRAVGVKQGLLWGMLTALLSLALLAIGIFLLIGRVAPAFLGFYFFFTILGALFVAPMVGILARQIICGRQPGPAKLRGLGNGLVAVRFTNPQYREAVRAHIAKERLDKIFTDFSAEPPTDFMEYLASKDA